MGLYRAGLPQKLSEITLVVSRISLEFNKDIFGKEEKEA